MALTAMQRWRGAPLSLSPAVTGERRGGAQAQLPAARRSAAPSSRRRSSLAALPPSSSSSRPLLSAGFLQTAAARRRGEGRGRGGWCRGGDWRQGGGRRFKAARGRWGGGGGPAARGCVTAVRCDAGRACGRESPRPVEGCGKLGAALLAPPPPHRKTERKRRLRAPSAATARSKITAGERGGGKRAAPPAHSSLTPLPLAGRARRSPRAPRPLGAPKVVPAALPHAIPGSRRGGGIRFAPPCSEWGAVRDRAGGADGYPERGPPPGSPAPGPRDGGAKRGRQKKAVYVHCNIPVPNSKRALPSA
ncbi:uncharacterized protein [Excalfactoria chinensis]|uniref:uncharacterized protein isoform X2 n=1 Tax=Excalfactoria chinensis TaxID=46218 RepID=UPI003B3BB01F